MAVTSICRSSTQGSRRWRKAQAYLTSGRVEKG